MVDFFIGLFKYLGIALGTLSGVFGLITDFRDKATSNITRQGFKLLAVILGSGFTSLVMQSLEFYRDKQNSDAAEARYLHESEKTNQVLSDLNRTLNLITDVDVTFSVVVPF